MELESFLNEMAPSIPRRIPETTTDATGVSVVGAASVPVVCASADAANAAASSWRTWIQSMPPLADPPVRRTASTTGLRLSPTIP